MSLDESVIHLEPINEMPDQVRDMVDERIGETCEDRKVKEHMRKLAEEEILKEIKKAEQFF
jgi:hypothetical protein